MLATLHDPESLSNLLLIDSEGGNVAGTLGVISELRASGLDLEGRVIGDCFSAAVHLLQACSHRTARRHADFFTHDIQLSDLNTSGRALGGFKSCLTRTQKEWVAVLATRTRKPAAFWRDFLTKERWFTATEALRLGLIDKVL